MHKSKTAALTAALAMMATPALAQGPDKEPRGQTTSPAKVCAKVAGLSKKKVPGTKGQSSWAACVSGAKRANEDAKAAETTAERKSPTQICRAITPALSKKKAAGTKKSPWSACVSGAARAQRELKSGSTS